MKNIWSKPQTRFAIFSAGRTGSNLLISLLNSHPDVFCSRNRLLLRRKTAGLFPALFLEMAARTANKRVYGHSIALHQFSGSSENLINLLKKLNKKEWLFIHLQRRNLVRQAISALIAQKKGEYHL